MNPNPPITLEQFLQRVNKVPGGCWLWTGAKTCHGYGKIKRHGKDTTAHRVSWELHFGPIPNLHSGPHGTCVCHSCDVRLCVNPEHLWLGSIQDDMADKAKKNRVSLVGAYAAAAARLAKTHCINGHPLSGDNLYLHKDGRRGCIICRKSADRRRQFRYFELHGKWRHSRAAPPTL